MIANGLKPPNDLYLEIKNQSMSCHEGYIYNITLSCNSERYLLFWLILRDDNAVLILMNRKTYLSNFGG